MTTIATLTSGQSGASSLIDINDNFDALNTGKTETSDKDATGGYAGLTLFKINFKNALNTITSFFTNANTVSRTYTFPDTDGTVALTSDIAGKEDLSNKSTNTSLGTSDTLYPSQNAVKTYADNLVAGLLDYRGAYDASVNTFPASGGSGTAGAVMKGDMWIVSVAGTLGGTAVQIGDSVIANVNTPAQTAGNWNILNSNISYIPEDVANKVTSISGASTDTQYPSAKLAYDQLALKANLNSPTFTGTPTLPTGTIATTQSANDNSTKVATTAYADLKLPKAGGVMTGKVTEAGRDTVGATYTPASGSQTVALDCTSNNMHVVSGNANGTAITFTVTGATNSQPFIVSILQGGTTVSTITGWFATVRWAGGVAPTLTATLNKRDTFGFIRTGTNTYDGFVIGQNA